MPQNLQYAPPAPRLRRFAIRSTIILSAAAAALLILPVLRVEWRRVREMYWQRACLSHEFPNGAVAFGTAPPVAVAVPKPWQRLSPLLAPAARPATLGYIHARQTPGGSVVLVVVEASAAFNCPSIAATTYRPAALDRDGVEVGEAAYSTVFSAHDEAPSSAVSPFLPSIDKAFRHASTPAIALDANDPVTIDTGITDPSDATHFTITYRFATDQRARVVDGWIVGSGTPVLELRTAAVSAASKFAARAGPAALR